MSMRLASMMLCVGMMLIVASKSQATEVMDPNDFRVYCGYLDEKDNPKLKKMSLKKRHAAIARLAGVKPAKLVKIIALGEAVGDNCEKISRDAEKAILDELSNSRVKGRIEFVEIQGAQWDQMVVRVRWKGDEDRYIEEEAVIIAWATYKHFPMLSTLAVAGFDPLRPEVLLFEGIIDNARIRNIDHGRIKDFADTRYIRLFDNRKFAKPRP